MMAYWGFKEQTLSIFKPVKNEEVVQMVNKILVGWGNYFHTKKFVSRFAECRFTGLTENCYTTNQSQESTGLTMLLNECCVGYWKAERLINDEDSVLLLNGRVGVDVFGFRGKKYRAFQ